MKGGRNVDSHRLAVEDMLAAKDSLGVGRVFESEEGKASGGARGVPHNRAGIDLVVVGNSALNERVNAYALHTLPNCSK